ncbi:MAG: hypothetical protein KME46_34465 [Brasilonema angustatum HA4187-MV1]|jgi:hypothetical protein|nr:hypothetical protein [Brasilonema angustatum HA4187-MV1]
MSQQLGIILMIDVNAAVEANTLEGHTYLFDNMKLQGSENIGTGKLISAINGSHFSDGSQANEQVLNWLPYGVGSLPPTLPKTFLADKSRNSDLGAIDDLKTLADKIEMTDNDEFTDVDSILAELKRISKNTGIKTKVQNKFQDTTNDLGVVGQKIMDVTGEIMNDDCIPDDSEEEKIPQINSLNPIITGISGEAVDKNIIYPAAYGSPDMVTDGWYWAASVDTSRPGTYAYTMDVQLYKLSRVNEEWAWVPVHMTCEAYLKISNKPKVNGFTGKGVGFLPIPMI